MSDTSAGPRGSHNLTPEHPGDMRRASWWRRRWLAPVALVVALVVVGAALSRGSGDGDGRGLTGEAPRLAGEDAPAKRGPSTTACPPIAGVANELCVAGATTSSGGGDPTGPVRGTAGSGASPTGPAAGATGSPGSAGAVGPAGAPGAPAAGGAQPGALPSSTVGPGGNPGGQPVGGSSTTAVPSGSTATAPPPPAESTDGGALPPGVIATICGLVRAAGEAPLRRGHPAYAPELDPDGNGLACE